MRRLLGVLLAIVLTAGAAPADQPDERILWQLYHAGKYRLLKQAIEEYRQLYPNWTPPPALQRTKETKATLDPVTRRQRRLRSLWRRKRFKEAYALMQRYPSIMNCRAPDLLWIGAAAYHLASHKELSFRLYQQALSCSEREIRFATLQKASKVLSPEDFEKLLSIAPNQLPEAELNEIRYQYFRGRLFENLQEKDTVQVANASKRIQRDIIERQDDGAAKALAWFWFHQKQWHTAKEWFETGWHWHPQDEDFAYGLALTLKRLGQTTEALAIAKRYAQSSKRLGQLARDSLIEQAWQQYRGGNYHKSRILLEEAATYPLPADEKFVELQAWLDLRQGRYRQAAHRFETLYRQHPEPKYAKALLISLDKAGLYSQIEQLGQRYTDPRMRKALARFQAKRLYRRKQFLAAHHADPSWFPGLANIEAPQAETFALYRFRSGRRGMDRLQTLLVPAFAGSFAKDQHRLQLLIGGIDLDSQRLNSKAANSLFPNRGLQSQFKAAFCQGFNSVADCLSPVHHVEAQVIQLSYQAQGQSSLYSSFGMTPINSIIAPLPTFSLGTLQHRPWGNWRVEAYGKSVQQSLLAYTGLEEQVSGIKWGRVLRTGIAASIFQRLGEHWGLSQSLDWAYLDGRRVRDNWTVSYNLALGYDLKLNHFDYFVVGPFFNYQHYQRNQNHFTPGHGGYFSPRHFLYPGLALNFLTDEGKSFIFKGRLGLGYQYFREDRAPWLPLGCFGRLQSDFCQANKNVSYSGNRRSKFAPDLEIKGAWLLKPQWLVGGGFYARKTNDWEELGAGIYVRYLFRPRQAVFSADIPNYLFGAFE